MIYPNGEKSTFHGMQTNLDAAARVVARDARGGCPNASQVSSDRKRMAKYGSRNAGPKRRRKKR